MHKFVKQVHLTVLCSWKFCWSLSCHLLIAKSNNLEACSILTRLRLDFEVCDFFGNFTVYCVMSHCCCGLLQMSSSLKSSSRVWLTHTIQNTMYSLVNSHARWSIFTFPGQNEPRPGHGTPWVNSGTIPAIPGRLASLGMGHSRIGSEHNSIYHIRVPDSVP